MKTNVAVVIMLCIFGVALSACKSSEVTEAEKRFLITAEALSPWLDEGVIDASKGKFSKPFAFSSDELEYEYESEDLFVSSGIHVESSESEASSTFTLLGLGLNIGLGGENIEKRSCDESLSLGEQSKCAFLESDGVTLGQFLIVQNGRHVLFLIIAGIEIDVEALKSLAEPYATRMSGYEP